MPALQRSFKTLRREWRSGELRLIAAALVVAVAAVNAVTLFTDRLRQAMVLRANTLLAADLASIVVPDRLPYLESPAPGARHGTDVIVSQHAVVGKHSRRFPVSRISSHQAAAEAGFFGVV